MKKKIFVSCILVLLSIDLFAQNNVDFNIGTVTTQLRNNAIQYGVNYLSGYFKNIGEKQINGKKSLLVILPDFTSEQGGKDAFSSIAVKLTGYKMFFQTTKIDEIIIPDLQKTFQVFPFSAGIETNSAFSFLNMIYEGGYFPWYQKSAGGFIKYTKFAVFLQAGYKFLVDTSTVKLTGGAKDQSNEAINKALLRIKTDFELNTEGLWVNHSSGFGISLISAANLWYDISNNSIYYKISGKARLHIDKKYFIDLAYEKGSGAPNFNQGDQFGVNLGVTF